MEGWWWRNQCVCVGGVLGNCNNSGERRNNIEQSEWKCRTQDKGFHWDRRIDTGTIIRNGIQKKIRKKARRTAAFPGRQFQERGNSSIHEICCKAENWKPIGSLFPPLNGKLPGGFRQEQKRNEDASRQGSGQTSRNFPYLRDPERGALQLGPGKRKYPSKKRERSPGNRRAASSSRDAKNDGGPGKGNFNSLRPLLSLDLFPLTLVSVPRSRQLWR